MEHFLEFARHNWWLWLALVAIVILIIIEELRGLRDRSIGISPQELTSKLNRNEAVVIDIRDKELFAQGHILGAINIPQAELLTNPEKLKNYSSKTIVLTCDTGRASTNLAAKLRKSDLQIFALATGLNGWRATAGLPLTKE